MPGTVSSKGKPLSPSVDARAPDPTPGDEAPPPDDLVGGLRRAWMLAAYAATGGPDGGILLARRLDDLARNGPPDRAGLFAIVEEAGGRLRTGGLSGIEPELTRRLQRAALEYLLAVDARRERPAPPDAGHLAAEPVATATVTAARAERFAEPPDRPGEPRPDSGRRLATALIDGDELTAAAAAHVELLLRRGRNAEAAAVLDRHAGQRMIGGLAAIAVAAGDRCRQAGDLRAAADCYLAACNADRLDEDALWRLAELAVEAGQAELASAYLSRLAAALQWRGDLHATMRIYRKMLILTPDRADVSDQLRRLETDLAPR